LIESHEIAQLIASQFTLIKKGASERSYKLNNWRVIAKIKWNRNWVTLNVKGTHLDKNSEFEYFKLRKAYVMSLISRSETYNSRGGKSPISEIILSSPEAQSLMNSKYPKIVVNENQIEFQGTIQKKDLESLSNVFTIFDTLLRDIENTLEQNAK